VEICSGFVMQRTQYLEIAGFVAGISASGHCGRCGALARRRFGVGSRRQQTDFGVSRIQPRVLHHDRYIGFE
jgi:hypothetical protein